MSKKGLKKRVMASFMAVAMMFSLIPSANVYAEELGNTIPTIEAEAVQETDATDETEIASDMEETVESQETLFASEEGATETSESVGDNIARIDVWDLGGEQLDGSVYNNRLTTDTINSWYLGVDAGTTGKNLTSFTVDDGDFIFNDGGFAGTHRLRSTNTAITRYDAKSLKDSDGNVYNGFIYSNKAKTDAVYVGVQCEENDIVTLVAASNGTDSEIVFENMNQPNDKQSFVHTLGGSVASVQTFYAADDAMYKFYSATEKLVVARVYRQHCPEHEVTGVVNAPAELVDYSIVFTNEKTGKETIASVQNGAYAVSLAENYSYTVSLQNANGYVVASDKMITVDQNASAFDIEVAKVTLATISGEIVGLSDEVVSHLSMKLVSDQIFVPNITKVGNRYSATVEVGVAYAVEIAGIDDYELVSPKSICVTEDSEIAINFEQKPVYQVAIDPVGADADDLAKATFTFVRHSDEDVTAEEDYVYSFTGIEGIMLRDGVYTVKVTNCGNLKQRLTSNLKIDGAAVTKVIKFDSLNDPTQPKSWSFTGNAYKEQAASGVFEGLNIVNGSYHSANYGMMIKNGSIEIPVNGPSTIQVQVGYTWDLSIEGTDFAYLQTSDGGTTSVAFEYAGKAGIVKLLAGNQATSYISGINVVPKGAGEIAEDLEITVGANGCDYTTINDALSAVRTMSRKDGQRTVIAIQPGDYEEMLVIDMDNISLVNASKTPSIEIKNQGVDIDDNAVRITSYYGHGYTYYSMGNDCKYDEEMLEVNRENGYPSFENPGSGTTNGSYWNATVVVAANGFEAEGIIFENSFNQYVSKKAASDVIVAQSSAKEGSTPRAKLPTGSTEVQNKKYVERAAALALTNNLKEISFENCKFIGRQDTLYGGEKTKAAFYDCAIYGGTDYIFGAMNAVFAKCNLVANTMEDGNDTFYITAAQTKTGRGMLFYNCHVTSTIPGVDTASEFPSKAGYFGRPWQASTGEAVFYATVIDSLDAHWTEERASLIAPAGWLSTLSGESVMSAEYSTFEKSGVDNQSKRASWASTLQAPVLADGTDIDVEAFLGNWDAFAGKDMEVVLPEGIDDTPVNPGTDDKTVQTTKFVLESSDMTAFAAGTKADGDSEKAGTEKYFTLIYSAKSKIDSSSKTFEDGYASVQRINFGGAVSTEKNAVKFTTNASSTVEVWWVEGGDDNRQMAILDKNGNQVAVTDVTVAKNACVISKMELSEGGTYYLGGATNNNYIFKVVVTDSNGSTAGKPERKEWASVAVPEITEVIQKESELSVTVAAIVGYDGADKITVELMDENHVTVASKNSSAEKDIHTVSFVPTASGKYQLVAKAVREGEEDKVSKIAECSFVLPLAAPVIKSATSAGNGTASIEWNAVAEAEGYVVKTGDQIITTDKLSAVIEGLTVGKVYEITVAAVRGDEISKASSIEVKITKEAQRVWAFSRYGSSVDTKNNGYTGSALDGKVTVYSESGKGKIVPGSTDGLAYYYTVIDPETENFTLTANVHVDNWTISNGQEGFGIMAADTVGIDGDGTAFWNNSYQLIASKIEYYHDGEAVTTDTAANKITMKLGLGYITKLGVTAADVASIKKGEITMPAGFSTESGTLESSCAALGAGTYNLIGNYKGTEPTGCVDQLLTDFVLQIQRNNTGYIMRYLDADGNVIGEKLYYDLERNALTQIDDEHIYLGFFASRNARITASDITLTTIVPSEDEAAQEREIEYVYPTYTIESANTANSEDYKLVYYGNADGILSIKNQNGDVVVEPVHVLANTKNAYDAKLQSGDNVFVITFTPDADYVPGEFKKLTSYETATFTHTVNYQSLSGNTIYVAQNGTAGGKGTKESPVDIYTAVKYAKAGQMILLAGGTYQLSRTVKVERGINGTVDQMIYMIADPAATERPVFDFGGKCAGMILAGDYWYFQGFDVTRSQDAQKGIQVSGNHNTLDGLMTYKNGNTGLQVSRYLGTDGFDHWPAYNLILNCTSFLNADKGYEDADGFAAKLTVGNGNVFDGCIAAYNADDGWDLFAKVQSGSIGSVTIQNSVTFMNGYVLKNDGGELDIKGTHLVDAGNGNGFKMGGDSMSGYHMLKNSIAFNNKAKGIDSNSCPDIQVYQSTSYNNESYNVAMYTNTAVNTDYYADGVLSYKKSNSVGETFKLLGTQDKNKVYGVTNYYFDGKQSSNTEGKTVSDEWFVSLDAGDAINILTNRNEDGTICMNGLLELTENAPDGVGARMSGTPSKNVEVEENPVEVTEIKTELGTWVSGSYSQAKAVVEDNEKRIRLTEALHVVSDNTYEAKVSDPAFRLIVRAKDESGKVTTFYLSNKDRFVAEKGMTYYVCAHNVYNNYPDITFEKYVELFQNGLSFAIEDVTEVAKEEVKQIDARLSTGQISCWVSGTYSQTKAQPEENRARMRLASALQVSSGQKVKAMITDQGESIQAFRYIIRKVDGSGTVESFYLSDGETFVAEEGVTYYVTTQNVWNNYKELDFQMYANLMEKGLVFDFAFVNDASEDLDESEEETSEEIADESKEEITEETGNGTVDDVVDEHFTHQTISQVISVVAETVVTTVINILKWFRKIF